MLTDIAFVKTVFMTEYNNIDDVLLDAVLESSSTFVKTFCNKEFTETTFNEKIRIGNEGKVYVKYPILEIINFDHDEEFFLNKQNGIIQTSKLRIGEFAEVEYRAGYTVRDGIITHTFPADLEFVVISLALKMYNLKQQITDGYNSINLEGLAYDFNKELTEAEKTTLNLYKNFYTVGEVFELS